MNIFVRGKIWSDNRKLCIFKYFHLSRKTKMVEVEIHEHCLEYFHNTKNYFLWNTANILRFQKMNLLHKYETVSFLIDDASCPLWKGEVHLDCKHFRRIRLSQICEANYYPLVIEGVIQFAVNTNLQKTIAEYYESILE